MNKFKRAVMGTLVSFIVAIMYMEHFEKKMALIAVGTHLDCGRDV